MAIVQTVHQPRHIFPVQAFLSILSVLIRSLRLKLFRILTSASAVLQQDVAQIESRGAEIFKEVNI